MLITLSCCCELSVAQSAQTIPQNHLQGQTREQVIAKLGDPDESSENSLTYGKAKIFFQDDKVVGISGFAELSKREAFNSNINAESHRGVRRDDLRGEWITPWASR